MIVVAGEALIDLTAGTDDGIYVARPGGSPYNVAVGLGRAAVPVAFAGCLSGDRFGRRLRSHLAESGVLLDHLATCDHPTTVAIVHSSAGEPDYSFYSEGTSAPQVLARGLPDLPPGAALHVGSISLVLQPGAGRLVELMRRESRRRLVTLDPNVRPALVADPDAYRAEFASWLGLVDVVKVSLEDLEWLAPGADPLATTAAWLSRGVVLAIVTMGAGGAVAVTPAGSSRRGGHRVAVADTVGAGDAFTSGVLAHLHHRRLLTRDAIAGLGDDELAALLDVAGSRAADTCTRYGADPPWGPPP